MLSDLAFAAAKQGYPVRLITSRLRYDDPKARLQGFEILSNVEIVRIWTRGCAFRPIRALRPAIAGSSERCRSGGVINTSGCRFWCQRLVLSSSAVQAVPVVHRRAPRVL